MFTLVRVSTILANRTKVVLFFDCHFLATFNQHLFRKTSLTSLLSDPLVNGQKNCRTDTARKMGHQGSNISFKAVVWLALSFFVQFLLAQDTVVIQTSYGKVTGINQGSTYEFLGIPFAQAPVESLRFSPPEPWEAPSAPETYVQDATSFKAACVQILYPNFYEFPGQPSEDCLYLNIYTPASEQLNSLKLPVMVWIHGGAFTGGSATQNSFNGSIVASSHQVLVVTINYRLGVLGFVAEESLCDENSSCGFYGILDQQMALRWVQTNINSFGGDPANVTIFGESAGGMSISVQLALSSSKGLFHGAIIESGIAEGYPSLETAKLVGFEFTKAMGCENIEASQVTACLRSASVESILAFQSTINDTNSWWPVINNAQLSYQPIDYVFNGDYNQVPVLLGCNTNEGWIFAMGLTPPPVSLSEYEQFLNEVFGGFAPEVIAEYPLADYNDSGFDAINAIIGDSLFVCPAQFLAQALNTPENTLPSYMYLFNCTPSWKIPAAGAYHGAELPFVWGYSPGNTFTPEEQILSDNITSWWSNFASSGNPNGFPALPGWPKYSSKLPDRLVLNCGNTEYITQYRETQCEFWRSYYSIYYAPAFESNPVNLLNIKNIWRHFVESRM